MTQQGQDEHFPPAERRLRLGVVGGGQGSFIGKVHARAVGSNPQAKLVAVADAFDMGFEGARRMIEDEEGAGLATALKAAGLSAAEAFLVAALAFPPRIGTTAAIRDFVDRYRALDVDDARRQVSAWRDKAPRSVVVQDQPAAAANSDDKPAPARRSLKAS